jgi:hypothetical protein
MIEVYSKNQSRREYKPTVYLSIFCLWYYLINLAKQFFFLGLFSKALSNNALYRQVCSTSYKKIHYKQIYIEIALKC